METKAETRSETTPSDRWKLGNVFPPVVSERNPMMLNTIRPLGNKETPLRAHPPYPHRARRPQRPSALGGNVCARGRVSLFPTTRARARSGRNGPGRARQRASARTQRDVRQTCAPGAKRRECSILKRFHGSSPAKNLRLRAGTSRQDRQSLFSVSDIFQEVGRCRSRCAR